MRNRIPLVIATIILLLTITMIPVKQAAAATGILQWSIVDTPGSQFNIVVSPSEVNALAVGGNTLYAIDIPHGKVYKSNDGGSGWDDISANLTGAGAALPAWNIAVSRDNPNIVASVTSAGGQPRQVFFSVDAGETWQSGNFSAAANIGALDVAMNYILAGTRTGAGGGNVYISNLAKFGGWVSQSFTGDILAVKMSPTFPADNSIIVINSDATGTYSTIGTHDIAGATTTWRITERVEITSGGGGSSPKAAQIKTADLELPFDFSGQNPAQKRMYICTNDANATGNAGIYRIDNTSIYKIFSQGAPTMISSIAYIGTSGNGKLLAGEVTAIPSAGVVNTWFSANPFVTCPQMSCVLWEKSTKPPTGGAGSGNANAQVAWSYDGGQAFCGTSSANVHTAGWPGGLLTTQSLDESSFSMSLNNGKAWNQLGLIDTDINFLSDVAASAGADIVYLSTINTAAGFNGFDSVWRSSGFPAQKNWERVFCFTATSNDTILRIGTPEGIQPIYVAARSTGDLWGSFDLGQTWSATSPGVTITDFTATKSNGINTLYALENAFVRTGQGSGGSWRWDQKVNTGLIVGHMITANSRGIVAVGEEGQGRIAYSTDGGRGWAQTSSVLIPGNMHPVIASNLAIYAGSDAPSGGIYAGGSAGWIPMEPPHQSFYGLAVTGTLYGVWSTGASSGADRTLYPESIAPPFIEWDSLTANLSPGVVFTREPNALKSSENGYLWAIDNRPYTPATGRLWAYFDSLTPVRPIPQPTTPVPTQPNNTPLFQAPVPVSPAINETIYADSGTGEINDIKFSWQHPTQAREYELWIATDQDFTQSTKRYTVVVTSNTTSPSVLLPSKREGITTGTTYYWKIRVKRAENDESGTGQWSSTMSFSVQQAAAPPPPVIAAPTPISPINGAAGIKANPVFSWTPVSDVTEYELTVARDSAFSQVIAQKTVTGNIYQYEGKLEPDAKYYWQVKAISPVTRPASATSSFSVIGEIKTPEKPPIYSNVILLVLAGVAVAAILTLTLILLKRRRNPK